MRRSMRRRRVFCLYSEKSCPVLERKRKNSFCMPRVGMGTSLWPSWYSGRTWWWTTLQDQLAHLRGGQDEIDILGRDGVAGHILKCGGIRCLGDGQPSLGFDAFHPQAAIAAGPGEHDADGALLLVAGQRAEEEVDGQAVSLAQLPA